MVIQTLKAQIASLTEAMKEKGVPEKVMTALKESSKQLQGLLDKAREAAGEGYETGGMATEEMGAEESIDPHKVKPGHKMTHTTTVKHEKMGGEEEEAGGEEPDPKDAKDEPEDDKSAEESRKVHLELLLKEAGIPEKMWNLPKLMQISLAEAKKSIAEKKALVEVAKKAVAEELDFVPAGAGEHIQESTGAEGNLNGLFSGCAE